METIKRLLNEWKENQDNNLGKLKCTKDRQMLLTLSKKTLKIPHHGDIHKLKKIDIKPKYITLGYVECTMEY